MYTTIILLELFCLFIFASILLANFESFKNRTLNTMPFIKIVLCLFIGTAFDVSTYMVSVESSLFWRIFAVIANVVAYTVEYFTSYFFVLYITNLSKEKLQIHTKLIKICKTVYLVMATFTAISSCVFALKALNLLWGDYTTKLDWYYIMMAFEAVLVILLCIVIISVRHGIPVRYWVVSWSIIAGLLIGRFMGFFATEADYGFVFSCMSILLMHLFIQTDEMQIIKEQSHAKEEFLNLMSCTDQITGLLNRRAYELHVNEIERKGLEYNLYYMMVDLNGLKFTNDTKGHAAGDEMIQGIARCLKEEASTFGNIYRVGGDEFACILHAGKKDINAIVDNMRQKAKDWKGELTDVLSFSVGYACASELDPAEISFARVAKLADERMYEDKQRFYENNADMDRRRTFTNQ